MSETLTPTESTTSPAVEPVMSFDVLSESGIEVVVKKRMDLLHGLRPNISRKLYYFLEERVKQEEAELKQLLDQELGKKQDQLQYSLVLDPHYFEQMFLDK